MAIKLEWRGPICIPNLSKTVKSKEDPAAYEKPHVYFYTQEYSGRPEQMVVYVGRADNFLKRMLEHYSGFLGFEYWLRNTDGEYAFDMDVDGRLSCFDQVTDKSLIAIEEVKRLKFFCASCQENQIKAVESALIFQVKSWAKKPEKFRCDNSRQEYHGWNDGPIYISSAPHQNCSGAAPYLTRILGNDEIQWPPKE